MISKKPKYLIVKSSSLGDVIQCFGVIDAIRSFSPNAQIDWIIDESLGHLLLAHPKIDQIHSFNRRIWQRKSLGSSIQSFSSFCKTLRQTKYDALFDFQGNTKSAVLSLFAKAHIKIGFGKKTVKEWPNLLATNKRYETDPSLNIQDQYIQLVEKYFQKPYIRQSLQSKLTINKEEQKTLAKILIQASPDHPKVMVCHGSRWPNKQIQDHVLSSFLQRIEEDQNPTFFLVSGNKEERLFSENLSQNLKKVVLIDRLSLPLWQNLIWEMDLLIGGDSSALHLCGTTPTKSFSYFGPTSAKIFQPPGKFNSSFQGSCPYQVNFIKQCPYLRKCKTGACLRSVEADALYQSFKESQLQKIT